MIKRSAAEAAQKKAMKMLDAAHIILTDEERRGIEIAEFGLGEFERTGLALAVAFQSVLAISSGNFSM